jgi:hypothetical protein
VLASAGSGVTVGSGVHVSLGSGVGDGEGDGSGVASVVTVASTPVFGALAVELCAAIDVPAPLPASSETSSALTPVKPKSPAPPSNRRSLPRAGSGCCGALIARSALAARSFAR